MEQEISDLLEELNRDFSAFNIAQLMRYAGFLEKGTLPEMISFSRYIFLKSKTDEIYGFQERQIIEQVNDIFWVTEFKKTMSDGSMPCQVIAVDMRDLGKDLYSVILFMKIVIKSYDGWTMFIFRLQDGIHIGMKVFERDASISCTMCDVSKTEDVLYDLLWAGEKKDFYSFYTMMYEVIRPQDEEMNDFDEEAFRKRGIQKEYIDSIEWLSKYLKRDMAHEASRYESQFEDKVTNSFRNEIEDTLEELKDIKSTKVNTLEMLFEAEESERLSSVRDLDYENDSDAYVEKSSDDYSLDLAGNDPETLIKMLKEKKGVLF